MSKRLRNRGELWTLPIPTRWFFFGITGDLAYKKIFPSLQAMVKRGDLKVPVIGVAKAGWNLDLKQLAESGCAKALE